MTASEMLANGFNPADYYYAGRILAGQAPMPNQMQEPVKLAINFIKQGLEIDMTKKITGSTAVATVGASNLGEVASQFGINSEDLGELARIGADSMSRAMFEVARAGLAFLRAQELLSLGNGGDRRALSERSESENGVGFVEWLNEHGFAQQRVYESMRIAKFVTQLPQEQRDDVLALGKVKVMLLASLPQEVIDQAAESGNDLICKADLMTVAQLKDEVSNLKKREKNYEAELERSQLQIKRFSETKKRLTEFEPRTEEIRNECMALQLEAELPINSLQKLFEEVMNEKAANATPEAQLRLEQVWIAAHIVASTALDTISELYRATMNGMDMPERALGTHILTPEEAQNWLLSRPMIENRHEAAKAQRKEAAEAAKPKGRGRPVGSKNKAGE